MKQTNQNISSISRFLSRSLSKNNSKFNKLIQSSVSILSIAIKHEEAHRSILTDLKIGSISQPFSLLKGTAYVKGVSNETLINLRNTNTPNFIRLHTAGLESDYMNTTKTESLLALEEDNFKNLKIDYFTHKISLVSYFLTGLIPQLSPKLEEEQNELDRDIVGNDIYGAVRHLHRPTMEFYRYTNHDDLTTQEKKFLRKISYYSFLNLINPIILGKNNFVVNDNIKMNAGLGYTIAPFGGFIDENIWFIINNKVKIHSYFRQFHNKENWFLGAGFELINYPINQHNMILNFGMDFWSQPENLSFITQNKDVGFGSNLDIGYKVYQSFDNKNAFYLTGGISYKQKGFLPEYSSLDQDTKLNVGFSYAW